MTPRLSARCAAPVAGVLLATGFLAASPTASAAPVFDDEQTTSEASTYVYPGYSPSDVADCTFDGDGDTVEQDGDLQENGPRATTVASIEGNLLRPDSTVERAITGELRADTLLRSADGAPTRIEVQAAGSIDADPPADATCEDAFVGLDTDLGSQFPVEETTLVTITGEVAGIDGHVDVQGLESDPGDDGERDEVGDAVILDLEVLATRSQVTVELQPGWWDLEIEAGLDQDDSADDAGELDLTATFTEPGERLSLRGVAKTLVLLPEARDCEASRIPLSITRNRADAAAIRRVELAVDGERVRTLRRPDAGQRLSLPTTGRRGVTVSATVFADPVGRQQVVRQRNVTATYEACARPTVR